MSEITFDEIFDFIVARASDQHHPHADEIVQAIINYARFQQFQLFKYVLPKANECSEPRIRFLTITSCLLIMVRFIDSDGLVHLAEDLLNEVFPDKGDLETFAMMSWYGVVNLVAPRYTDRLYDRANLRWREKALENLFKIAPAIPLGFVQFVANTTKQLVTLSQAWIHLGPDAFPDAYFTYLKATLTLQSARLLAAGAMGYSLLTGVMPLLLNGHFAAKFLQNDMLRLVLENALAGLPALRRVGSIDHHTNALCYAIRLEGLNEEQARAVADVAKTTARACVEQGAFGFGFAVCAVHYALMLNPMMRVHGKDGEWTPFVFRAMGNSRVRADVETVELDDLSKDSALEWRLSVWCERALERATNSENSVRQACLDELFDLAIENEYFFEQAMLLPCIIFPESLLEALTKIQVSRGTLLHLLVALCAPYRWVEAILRYPFDRNARDDQGRPPILLKYMFPSRRHYPVMQEFMVFRENEFDVSAKDSMGRDLAEVVRQSHKTFRRGDEPFIQQLIKLKVFRNATDFDYLYQHVNRPDHASYMVLLSVVWSSAARLADKERFVLNRIVDLADTVPADLKLSLDILYLLLCIVGTKRQKDSQSTIRRLPQDTLRKLFEEFIYSKQSDAK